VCVCVGWGGVVGVGFSLHNENKFVSACILIRVYFVRVCHYRNFGKDSGNDTQVSNTRVSRCK